MDAKKGIGLLTFLLLIPSWAPAAEFAVGGEILFTKTGDLHLQLTTEEEFEKNLTPPFSVKLSPGPDESKKRKVSFQFKGVPEGTYGIRCFQDVNGNQKLDGGIFGPAEPWGVYRSRRPTFRGPKFEEISFAVDQDMTNIQIEVK